MSVPAQRRLEQTHPTHVVFVGGVSGQIPQKAGQRPQLHVTVGV